MEAGQRIEKCTFAQFILTISVAGITVKRRALRDHCLLCMVMVQDIIMKIYPGRRGPELKSSHNT